MLALCSSGFELTLCSARSGILAFSTSSRPPTTYFLNKSDSSWGGSSPQFAGKRLPLTLSLLRSPFFVTFWQLTLYDIVYPKERYDSELVRCSAMSREANSSLTLKTDDKRKFSDGVSELARKLTNEFGEHATARGVTQRRLTREKGQWFAASAWLSSSCVLGTGF